MRQDIEFMTAMTSYHRRAYIDWARGIARAADDRGAHDRCVDAPGATEADCSTATRRSSAASRRRCFCWLAGLAVRWRATRSARQRTGSRAAALEAIVPARPRSSSSSPFSSGIQAFIVSARQPLVTLFRVDILNIMGPAIVGAGLVWSIASSASGARVVGAVGDRGGDRAHGDADRARLAAGRRAADWVAVVRMRPAGEFTDLHAVAVGRLRLRRRRGSARCSRRRATIARAAARINAAIAVAARR